MFQNKKTLLDISKEFAELKVDFSCEICKNIFIEPVILNTCNHVICKSCLSPRTLSCPICKSSYFERDTKTDFFTDSVAEAINNIESIFRTAGPFDNTNFVTDFKTVTIESVMKKNPKGETPLHIACKKGSVNKVEELLRKNVDLNVTDYASWTSLHEAVESGSYDCCRLLLKSGALPNVPGEFYTSPLHKAATLNNKRIAKLLIKYGADRNAIDYYGKKPVDLAVSKEMTDVFENTSQDIYVTPHVYLHPSAVAFCQGESNKKLTKSKAKFVTANDFVDKDEVTHLVLLNRNNKLNMSILIAILKGVFVVHEPWLDDCTNVSFNYVPDMYKATLSKSIRNRWLHRPRLFDGINFHIIDHKEMSKMYDVNLTKQDLIALIKHGGGKYVIRPPALRTVEGACCFPFHVDRKSELTMCCNYIIYSENNAPDLLYNMKELRHKSSRWLIDCILKFCLLDF